MEYSHDSNARSNLQAVLVEYPSTASGPEASAVNPLNLGSLSRAGLEARWGLDRPRGCLVRARGASDSLVEAM